MSRNAVIPELETCEIVWWRGYVKGRFLALTRTAEGERLIGESPALPWRSATPPGPTEAAVAALDALTAQLVAAGWEVEARDEETWPPELIFSRPRADVGRTATDAAPTANVKPVLTALEQPREPQAEPPLDAALLEQLQMELAAARAAAGRERARRLEAEAESNALRRADLVEAPPVEAPPRPAAEPVSPGVLFVAYAIAVTAAFGVGLVGFESVYAAVVAALTTCAVSVAIDSWLVARRRIAAAR